MQIPAALLDLLKTAMGYGLISAIAAFAWAPLLIKLLYRYQLTRNPEYDATLAMGARKGKIGVPVMGGLLVIITVAVITYLFNWERRFTWVPIGVMLLSATLGGIDDVLHIYGHRRRSRKLKQVFTLIRVHRFWFMRLWYLVTLPWWVFKRTSVWLSRDPGRGVHVHEKLILQFIAGAITASWIYTKLGPQWREIFIPFDGYINIGWLIIPLIIFFVMFTANAVNVADGMDGLRRPAQSSEILRLRERGRCRRRRCGAEREHQGGNDGSGDGDTQSGGSHKPSQKSPVASRSKPNRTDGVQQTKVHVSASSLTGALRQTLRSPLSCASIPEQFRCCPVRGNRKSMY